MLILNFNVFSPYDYDSCFSQFHHTSTQDHMIWTLSCNTSTFYLIKNSLMISYMAGIVLSPRPLFSVSQHLLTAAPSTSCILCFLCCSPGSDQCHLCPEFCSDHLFFFLMLSYCSLCCYQDDLKSPKITSSPLH